MGVWRKHAVDLGDQTRWRIRRWRVTPWGLSAVEKTSGQGLFATRAARPVVGRICVSRRAGFGRAAAVSVPGRSSGAASLPF